MKFCKPIAALLLLVGVFFISAVGQETKRAAVPDAKLLKRAADLAIEIFQDDLKTADAPTRIKIANQLLQQAREARDDAALRFALFRYAGQLAESAGDYELGLVAVEELNRDFLVDGLALKAASLESSLKVAGPETSRGLCERALHLVHDALEADHHEAALLVGTVAEAAARKANSEIQLSAARKRLDDVRGVQKSFARLQGYIDRLKKNPRDGEANLELGRYYSLFKGRWEKALPLLAMGSDSGLKSLAERDLAEPKDARAQLALADLWWDRAAAEKDPAQLHLQRRAMFWYEKALLDAKGLSRTKALRRIDQVSVRLAGTIGETGPLKVGELFKFDGHTEEIKAVALSADGRLAASGAVDQSVRIWDLATGKPGPVIKGHNKQVWGVAFHPTNRTVFSASWDGTLRQWDPATGAEVGRFTHPKDINSLGLSRDGTQIMAGCDDYQVHVWNTATKERIRAIPGHTNFVYGVAFSNDMKYGASGGTDRTVRVFDLASGQLVKALEGSTYSVYNVAFSADNRYVFSSGDDFARQWDIAAGKEFRRFEGHSGKVTGLAISPDGRRLLTGGDDKTVRLWDVSTGKEIAKMTGHTDSVTCVGFSYDGRRAISGSYDRTVRVWGLPER